MRLYRPTGPAELLLVYRSGMRRWPRRLPEQPIFYPVLNLEYATQIARDWNATSADGAGYVTEFDVDDAYARRFDVKTVGGSEHAELWVPAEDLDVFNDQIIGQIHIVGAYVAPGFGGAGDASPPLHGLSPSEQLAVLAAASDADLPGLVRASHEAIFAHYPLWATMNHAPALARLRDAWAGAVPEIPLGTQRPGAAPEAAQI